MAVNRTIEERVKIVLLYAKFENYSEVSRRWKDYFSTPAPDRRTVSSVYQKFVETGSVENAGRSGHPLTATTLEGIELVRDCITESPQTSVRQGAAATGMSSASFYRALKKINLSPYQPQQVIELSDDDVDRREEFCLQWYNKFENEAGLVDKIVWSDEAEFKLNGTVNQHNCCYWACANPHVNLPVEHTARGVMTWCAVTSGKLLGPYFFNGPVNGESYLQMLQDFAWPQMRYQRQYFQHDGAPAHYATAVRTWLDKKFPGRWLGRRGPFEWPARSPDLTPPDFYLWGRLKNDVYKEKCHTLEELRDRIRVCCAELDPDELTTVCRSVPARYLRCVNQGGTQLTD